MDRRCSGAGSWLAGEGRVVPVLCVSLGTAETCGARQPPRVCAQTFPSVGSDTEVPASSTAAPWLTTCSARQQVRALEPASHRRARPRPGVSSFGVVTLTHAVAPTPLCSPWGVFSREGTGPVVAVVGGEDAGTVLFGPRLLTLPRDGRPSVNAGRAG